MSAPNKIVFGRHSETVVANIVKLRAATGMSWADLSRKTTIPAISLRRMSEKRRRVTIDDLVLIAAAFGLTWSELMEPIGAVAVTTSISVNGAQRE